MAVIFDPILGKLRKQDTSTGGSAHVIQEAGTPLADRANLNFRGFDISDDAGNDATIVDLAIQLEDIRTGAGADTQGLVVRTTTGSLIRSIQGADSLSVTNEDGTAGNPTVVLEGDTASPGNFKVYGTDGTGVKGWQSTGGSGMSQAQVLARISIGF